MEEYELVSHVLRIIDQTAYRFAARRILGVHLAVGGCRVFDFDRLHSVFSDAARGTIAEGAELSVKVLPVPHHCQNCGDNFEATKSDCPCPRCNHLHTEVVGGEELRILSLEIEETAA